MIDPESFGHRHHRLAPTIQHQAPQIQPAVDPLLTPRERLEHLAREVLQPATNGVQLLRGHLEHALEGGQGLDWLSDGHRAVTAALAVSVEHLTPDQQHALRLAGLHPGPDLEPYALAALADTTLDQARRLLEQLHAASLLDQPAHRRYTLHDLVADYARRLAAELPEPNRHAALDRLYDHYAATTARAMDLTYPWEAGYRPRPAAATTPTPSLPDPERAQAWLDIETDNLLAAAHHAATGHRADHTLHQSAALHWPLRRRHHYAQAVLLHERAQQLAHATADRHAELDALNCVGHIHRLSGRYGPATDCYGQALGLARQTGHLIGEQNALLGFGHVHDEQGRYQVATDYYQRALDIAHQIGNRAGEMFTLHGLGHVHYAQGHYQPATDYYQQALDIAHQTDNRYGERLALDGLGHVHYAQGHYQPATDYYERALGLARENNDHNGQFEAHQGLGRVRHATQDHRDALCHHQAALHLALDLDQPQDQARALDGLAHAHLATANSDEAHRDWQAALHLLLRLGNDHTEDPEVTTRTIRARLHALDNPSTRLA
jgi:tetratricopeptide (TPR) repeat protein